MLTRRNFLNGTLGAGFALATQRAQPLAAQQQRRTIVDSQIHMWKASTPDRPWVPGTRPQLPEPMTIERVVPMIDAGGVDRVVIVPPGLEGEVSTMVRKRPEDTPAVLPPWATSCSTIRARRAVFQHGESSLRCSASG